MKILLTEEALQTQEGHFLNYLTGITRGLREAGDTVDLLAHCSASPEVSAETEAIPWFRRNCRTDPRSQGLGGFVTHNYSTYRDLAYWLRKHPGYDWLLNLATRRQQLMAFTALAYNKQVMPGGRLLLLFVLGFGLYSGAGSAALFRKDPSTLICRLLLWCLGPAVKSGRVVLAAETREMQRELGLFCGLPIQYLPHPIDWADEAEVLSHGATQRELSGRDRFVVTCPGFARFEKGSDLLLEAIRELERRKISGDYFFIMQWLKPFASDDGKMHAPDVGMESRGGGKFIGEPMDSKGYRSMLERSDAVILPYRAESYHNRVSRVAIEAAALGIPLIYTKGTWIEEVAQIAEVGIPIESESMEAIIDALNTARSRCNELSAKAKMAAEKIQEFYSTRQFRMRLSEL
jgi:glycosyltransferase involved in cell wall biosynthesis